MASLTMLRQTVERSGDRRNIPLAAGAVIFKGALVAINASGFLVPMAASASLQGVGCAESSADNTGGANGDLRIEVGAGIYQFENSSGGDEIGRQDIGKPCYGVDDQTVALTSAPVESNPTRSVAGTIFDVDAEGVWVKFS